MSNTYLISDEYFKEQYPADNSLDTELFYSTLLIEQNTSLEDVLGEDLKEWLITNAVTITDADEDEYKLLKKAQYILVFMVKQSLLTLKRVNGNENADITEDGLTSKIMYLKAKLKTFINSSDTIKTLIGTDDTYSSEQTYSSPIVFWSDI